MSDYTYGTYKIWHAQGIFNYWVFVDYRIRNGITEQKVRGNSFAQWMVGSIPDGAIIINSNHVK